MDTSNKNTSLIIAGIILVLVIGAGWWLFTGGADTNMDTETPTTTEQNGSDTDTGATGTPEGGTSTGGTSASGTTPTTTPAAGEAVAVADQAAGATVAIDSMSLTGSSWVAVRDERSILGASRFEAGATSGTVRLIRGTVPGATYQVVIYRDNGDGAFDFKIDALVSGVSDSFTTTQ
jgi:hypothetical protein